MTKRLLVSMGLMALAVMLITAGTLALFTAEVTNAGNTFATGTLSIEDITNGNGSAGVVVSNIAPGDSETATFSISNTGSLDAWVKISDVLTDGDLFEDPHPIVLNYSSDAVRINAGASANFIVDWSFPIEAGNGYQGASGSFEVLFDAVQYRNNEDSAAIEWGN